jgi:hypothetical protein
MEEYSIKNFLDYCYGVAVNLVHDDKTLRVKDSNVASNGDVDEDRDTPSSD